MNFFNNLDQRKIELNSLNKLTIENLIEWTNYWTTYLDKNNLNDFLKSKNNYSFKEQHLLIDLILSTISDQFKTVYLNEFKYNSFYELWLDLNRCFQYPSLKPILNQLKSIKLNNFNCLIDYCKEFSNLLDKIPNEFIDNNFHNIMSLFYQSNDNKIVHICFRRLVDNNQKLILPKNKLSNKQFDHKSIKQKSSPKFNNRLEHKNYQQLNYQYKRDHLLKFNRIENKSNQKSTDSINQRSSNTINQKASNSINQRSTNSFNQRSSNSFNQRSSNPINQRSSNSFNQRSSNPINQRSTNSFNQRPTNSINQINNLSNIKHQPRNLFNNQLYSGNLINKNSRLVTNSSINKDTQSITNNLINKNSLSITNYFAKLNLDQPNQIICGYCKNVGHIKKNCFKLKNKTN